MISKSPLEKVARAIYESHEFVRPWDHPKSVGWHRVCRAEARAALTALLDPDDGTVEAGYLAQREGLFKGASREDRQRVGFVASIQHILKGKADE